MSPTLLSLWSLVHVASAEEAPEFLLGNLGVRVDLPRGWKMTRWSDDDFSGQTNDGSVLVFAWSTPIQVPITEAAPWERAFTAKVEEMSGKSPTPGPSSVEEIAGRKVALVDVGFQFGDGGRGTMYGAVLEIPGRDFLIATISPDRFSKAAQRARRDLVERLEHSDPPPASTFGETVKLGGVETVLPDDFRPALDSEWSAVSPTLAKFGREDWTDCWIAIRPLPMKAPDVLASCPSPLRLGVVDAYSFDTAEETVRAKLFGKALDPGTMVELPDRVGFLYAPRDGLAMGAVPTASGVASTWGLGESNMSDAVRATLTHTTFDGPHPVEGGEVLSYWVGERTFSPQVLCPSLCCVGAGVIVVGAGGLVAMRGRRRNDEEDDD
ncbi:MAG: hypothetical protein KC621_05380 [Myxococcales bacterium]|nr:hypothetical protein [Myxococcales bacterium]